MGSQVEAVPKAAIKPILSQKLGQWVHYLPQRLGRWARYLYFLRFSLTLWLFAPILCVLNCKSPTLTSGILVSDFMKQYFCIGFFLVSAGLAALILARIVLINGPERWDLDYQPEGEGSRPTSLTNLMVNNAGHREGWAVFVSQVPNLLVLGYFLWYGHNQDVAPQRIAAGLITGGLVAGLFWWVPNAWYYLSYRSQEPNLELKTFVLGKNAARTILYPRIWFWLHAPNEVYPGTPTIERACSPLVHSGRFRFLARLSGYQLLRDRLASQPGYGIAPGYGKSIYESHAFAFISFLALFGLNLLIWPLTAPVPAPTMSTIAIVALAGSSGLILLVFWTVDPPTETGKSGLETAKSKKDRKDWIRQAKLTKVKVLLTLGVLAFDSSVLYLDSNIDGLNPDPERFPIFATLLILTIAVCWLLGGLAFFLDRYRFPVLTAVILLLVAPRMLHLDRTFYWNRGVLPLAGHSQEEHYLSTTSWTDVPAIPTPGEVLQRRRASAQDNRPLIIVTATGGGLHASAWTEAILGNLEGEFGPDFHKHLLLISTVSGGSVALLAYLRELKVGTLDGAQAERESAIARMQSVAQCSSLEGVGWGLVYYDLPKAFIPGLPYLVPPSSGVDDMTHTPILKDRTWSLRKSFERNLSNEYCDELWQEDNDKGPNAGKNPPTNWRQKPPEMTLRTFLNTSRFPAFTMNTTEAETGERFLLANYAIPDKSLEPGPSYRAKSFLMAYGSRRSKDGKFADLPLATAAQMSATFPYISSAARVPVSVDNLDNNVHFVDGGYYDNDGTASAIEFLHYALDSSVQEPTYRNRNSNHRAERNRKPEQGQKLKKREIATRNQKGSNASEHPHPVRVLLIEIRNSNDIEGSPLGTEPDHIPNQFSWNLFNQLGAPPLGFWQAGHESATARNQSGLELLEKALGEDRLLLHRIVFADLCSVPATGTDPLNWSLTPKQREEVMHYASVPEMRRQYDNAKNWFEANSWPHDATTEDGRLSYNCNFKQ